MSASSDPRLAFPKLRPRALDQQDRKDTIVTTDAAESRAVKQRSGGQCEIIVAGHRCHRRAFHVHHMLSGWGRRARGRSALAEHKQHACSDCHTHITAHVLRLKHVTGELPRWTDTYERAR